MNIELANGAEGYIPPPEQHTLGGYTTWPARTAGLEMQAEPQIVETLTRLLEVVSKKLRRELVDEQHSYAKAVTESTPHAFWRLGEIDGLSAADAVGHYDAIYEDGVAFYLPGPKGHGLNQQPRGNRSAHFAGGRVAAKVPKLGNVYSIECWIWNGFPNSDRAVTGYFFSRGPDGDARVSGDHLGIGGNYKNQGWDGKLLLFNGNERDEALIGRTVLETRTWHHVVFVRDDRHVTVFLNGHAEPEINDELEPTYSDADDEIFLGGRSDRMFGLEGRLDEVALYDRILTTDEITNHYAAARLLEPLQVGDSQPIPNPPPLSPQESMKVAHLRDGFELQLVAAEPLVKDPVAIDWGPDGKLWVAEMADYPNGMDDRGRPGGRIVYLEDKVPDAEGRYDSRTNFLTGIPFPTGHRHGGSGNFLRGRFQRGWPRRYSQDAVFRIHRG